MEVCSVLPSGALWCDVRTLHCRKEPLGGLTVVIVGRLSQSQAALGKEVASQGGTVVTNVSPKVDLCISKKGNLCLS